MNDNLRQDDLAVILDKLHCYLNNVSSEDKKKDIQWLDYIQQRANNTPCDEKYNKIVMLIRDTIYNSVPLVKCKSFGKCEQRCPGTCPACDAELEYLNNAIEKLNIKKVPLVDIKYEEVEQTERKAAESRNKILRLHKETGFALSSCKTALMECNYDYEAAKTYILSDDPFAGWSGLLGCVQSPTNRDEHTDDFNDFIDYLDVFSEEYVHYEKD